MGGVLHHLKDREGCLKKMKENYSLIFIGMPIKKGIINWLELGHPSRKEEIQSLFDKYLTGSQIFYYENNILLFYESPK